MSKKRRGIVFCMEQISPGSKRRRAWAGLSRRQTGAVAPLGCEEEVRPGYPGGGPMYTAIQFYFIIRFDKVIQDKKRGGHEERGALGWDPVMAYEKNLFGQERVAGFQGELGQF